MRLCKKIVTLGLTIVSISACATVCDHKTIYEGQEYYGCTLTIDGAF